MLRDSAKALDKNLWEGRTIKGRPLIVEATTSQNYARVVISRLQHLLIEGALNWVSEPLERSELLAALADAIDKIEPELTSEKHYGDNRPGLFTSDRVPLLPDPFFTYYDLFQFGLSDPETGEQVLAPEHGQGRVVAACGLLDCDWAIRLLEEGDAERAAYVAGQASTCLEVLDHLLSAGDEDSTSADTVRAAMSKTGREGGRLSGEARLEKKQRQQAEAIRLYNQYRAERRETPEHGLPALVARKMQLGLSTIYGYLKEHRLKASSEGVG